MDVPIRVGILGLGRSGWNIHALGLAAMSEQYAVVAVSDPLEERMGEASDLLGASTHLTPDDVIQNDNVDVVVVATPSHTHTSLAAAALKAGKHVVVEKPIAQSTMELDYLATLAHDNARVLTCFHNNRFDPAFVAVRDLVASGRIGDVLIVRRTNHRFSRRTDWQTLRRYGGGELANASSHILDQMLAMFPNEVTDVIADLRLTVSAGDAEDHARVTLKLDGGPIIDIETSSSIALPQDAWFVAGTAGGVSGNSKELEVKWLSKDDLSPLGAASPGAAEGRRYGEKEKILWRREHMRFDFAANHRTVLFYSDLFQALTAGGEPVITVADLRRQLKVVERARRASGLRGGS